MSFVIKTGKTVDEAVENALRELRLTRDQVEVEVLEEPSKGFLGIFGGNDATVKVTEIMKTEDLLKEILQDDFNGKKEESKTTKKRTPKRESVNEEKSEVKKTPEVERKSEVKETKQKDIKSKEAPKPVAKEEEEPKEERHYSTEAEQDAKIREYMAYVMKPLKLDYELDISRTPGVIEVNVTGAPEKMGIVIGKRGVTLDAIQYILSLIINRNTEKYTRIALDSSGYRAKREETLKNLAEKMARKALRTSRSVKLEPMNAAERRIIHSSLQDFEGVSTHSEGREPYRKVVIHKERKY